MQEITLQALLEAGCHFGHKSERWHPKATEFIFAEKDGIHIIDLAKTKIGLENALKFISNISRHGGEVLFVGSKRQARGVVREEAEKVGAPYLVERWIGGFLTNWDGIRKNIEKIIRLTEEEGNGTWKKYPKHERSKLHRYLVRLKFFYGGVLNVKSLPEALFVVDVKKENSAVREAERRNIPIVAIVDTNADPRYATYPIPANDDAVGSVQFITRAIANAYLEGKNAYAKEQNREQVEALKVEVSREPLQKTVEPEVQQVPKTDVKIEPVNVPVVKAESIKVKPAESPVGETKKRGRPNKSSS